LSLRIIYVGCPSRGWPATGDERLDGLVGLLKPPSGQTAWAAGVIAQSAMVVRNAFVSAFFGKAMSVPLDSD